MDAAEIIGGLAALVGAGGIGGVITKLVGKKLDASANKEQRQDAQDDRAFNAVLDRVVKLEDKLDGKDRDCIERVEKIAVAYTGRIEEILESAKKERHAQRSAMQAALADVVEDRDDVRAKHAECRKDLAVLSERVAVLERASKPRMPPVGA